MTDIAQELRERSLRAEREGEPLSLLDDAADEIERLRLTDAERMAVDMAIINCHQAGGVDGLRVAATLRSLLERTTRIRSIA
jgi:hypothetical protein